MRKNQKNLTPEQAERNAIKQAEQAHTAVYVKNLGGVHTTPHFVHDVAGSDNNLAHVMLIADLDHEGYQKGNDLHVRFVPAEESVVKSLPVYVKREFMTQAFGSDINGWPTELCLTFNMRGDVTGEVPEVETVRNQPPRKRVVHELSHDDVDAMAAQAGIYVDRGLNVKKGSTDTTGTLPEGTVGVDVKNEPVAPRKVKAKAAYTAPATPAPTGNVTEIVLDTSKLSLPEKPKAWSLQAAPSKKLIRQIMDQLEVRGCKPEEARAKAEEVLINAGYCKAATV